MDSQNPFFLDILQDKEQGFESLMSTPHLDVNVHQSPPEVEMGQSTVDEDIKLVSAWLNVSLDAVTSTDQKHLGR